MADSIVALLDRLDRQVAADHMSTPAEDNAIDTLQTIRGMLSDASPGDLEKVLAMPAHFAQRAREAQAAGRSDEAQRFTMLADFLGDQPHTLGLSIPAAPRPAGETHDPSALPEINVFAPSRPPRPAKQAVTGPATRTPGGTAAPAALRGFGGDNIAASMCRFIAVKFGLGEEPSAAERSYLREGCQRG